MESVPGVMVLGWMLGAWQVAKHAWPDGILYETPATMLHQMVIGAFIGIYLLGLRARARQQRPEAEDLGEIRREVNQLQQRFVFREDWTSRVGAAAQHDELTARRQRQQRHREIRPARTSAN